MMKKHHLPLEEAFDKMRQLRQIVDPNVSFIVQLKEWEKSLRTMTPPESADEQHSGTNNPNSNNTRAYCGSTSKSKSDSSKSHTDAPIEVN